MKYGSVCSGIEAASVAWEVLGWQPSWFAEVEAFPSAVLNHHWPDVLNHGDMTKLPDMILAGEIEAPDVLVGGTPCQSFSFAGLRGSLSDERGNLTLKFVEIANAIRHVRRDPIIVWENVPGVLNTADNAFGHLLAGLAGEDEPLQPAGERWTDAGCVYGPERAIAWRVLDAQYFGVPQRRRRVFVVASSRNGADPCEILFEPKSVRRNSEESGEKGQNIAAFAESGFGGYRLTNVGATLCARGGSIEGGSETLVVHGTQDPCISNKAFALGRNNGGENVICLDGSVIGRKPENGGNGIGCNDDGVCYTLTATDRHAVQANNQIRRLTPVECERLQGFPDNHTRIPWRGKDATDCPDGSRYKAIGNSMAVPVMRWIGNRIEEVA